MALRSTLKLRARPAVSDGNRSYQRFARLWSCRTALKSGAESHGRGVARDQSWRRQAPVSNDLRARCDVGTRKASGYLLAPATFFVNQVKPVAWDILESYEESTGPSTCRVDASIGWPRPEIRVLPIEAPSGRRHGRPSDTTAPSQDLEARFARNLVMRPMRSASFESVMQVRFTRPAGNQWEFTILALTTWRSRRATYPGDGQWRRCTL